MAQASDYTSLLPSTNASKPKFSAMVALVAGCFADVTNATQSLSGSFDLDLAVGAQLDSIGLWVGVSRKVSTTITGIYFAFDAPGLGFEQGYIQGPYDPSSGITSLDDATFRTLIKSKALANSFDGTMAGASKILGSLFTASGSYVFLQDNQDMSMTIGWAGALPSGIMRALLTSNALQIKPEGVSVNYAITSVNGAPVFGFDAQNQYVSGFDSGAFALTS